MFFFKFINPYNKGLNHSQSVSSIGGSRLCLDQPPPPPTSAAVCTSTLIHTTYM